MTTVRVKKVNFFKKVKYIEYETGKEKKYK